jgi:hypothetical protein
MKLKDQFKETRARIRIKSLHKYENYYEFLLFLLVNPDVPKLIVHFHWCHAVRNIQFHSG